MLEKSAYSFISRSMEFPFHSHWPMVLALLLFAEKPNDMHWRIQSGSIPPPSSAKKERKKERKERKIIRDAIRMEFLQLMSNLSTTQILIPIGASFTHKWTMLQRTYGSQFRHWLHYHHTNLTFNNKHGCTRLWIPYHVHTHISGTICNLQTSQIPPLRKFSSSSQTFLAKHPYPNLWVSGSMSEWHIPHTMGPVDSNLERSDQS